MLERIKLGKTDAGLEFDLTLDAGKPLYCFIGKNGVGKTNLLTNLTRVLLARHAAFANHSGGWKLLLRKTVGEAFDHKTLTLPATIELASGVIKGTESDWGLVLFEQLSDLQLAGALGPPAGLVEQPVVMVSTRGRGHTRPLRDDALRFVGDSEAEFVKALERTWTACMDEGALLESVGPWIAERLLINPSFIAGARVAPEEVALLCDLLVELDPKSFAGLIQRDDARRTFRIGFSSGQLKILETPIEKLATGYIAVIKMLQEIVASLSAWSQIRGQVLDRNAHGIVLIDELDSHLHPQWQIGLLGLLKRSFPNVTYIVATHSPLLVAQTEEGEAYELVREGNRVTSRRIGSPKDWYLADVYANAFHVAVPMTGSVPNAEGRTLIERLEALAVEVKRFTASKDPSARDAALRLATEIEQDIPADDPRRRSVESLRGLVQ